MLVSQIVSYANIASPVPAQIPIQINSPLLESVMSTSTMKNFYYFSFSSGSTFVACGGGGYLQQPGFDFPTDLPVRGVVPSTQRFGTVTMLAQTQAEQPPPLFPGLWECNTLRTKSHFPFLSNFHTPAPLLLRLACPLKRELW